SISQPNSSLRSDTVLFHGSCDYSRNLNIGLHLLLNLISSAVLASSNYFMQIINAPSRHEIDRAHQILTSLEIGIPSLKNLSYLSKSKRLFWVLILITSLPIHLFFNSSIYETSFVGSTWQLTIAAESFLHGSPFFPPGASLAPAGSLSPTDYNSTMKLEFERCATPLTPDCDAIDSLRNYWGAYGEPINLPDYWDNSSSIRQNLSHISSNAIKDEQASLWKRLSSKECRQEYCHFKPRDRYGDVVVVVKPGASPAGWTRDEVYADPQNNLTGWDIHVPRNETNSLWFSTQCRFQKALTEKLSEGYSFVLPIGSTCAGALGFYWYALEFNSKLKLEEWDNQEDWSIMFKKMTGPAKSLEESLGYNESFSSLPVEYCLADLAPTRECKVIVANSLISVTLLCIFFKIIICTAILRVLPNESLVTPGDAIDSFLSKPDPETRGLGTCDVRDVHRMEYSLPYPLAPHVYQGYGPLTHVVVARGWQPKKRTIVSAMPRSAWWRAYAPIVSALSLLSYLTASSYQGNEGTFEGSFGHGQASLTIRLGAMTNLEGLIVANIGQLVLSWCYFSYNSLLTRIHVEKELNLYSRSFRPLRVSFPKGEQISTWRLQLPYYFGIPLLTGSIILHWLASNSIFLLIMEGGKCTSAG
ncbi:hypothetical protein PG996_003172, partial [Apiospora saccharicola]